MSKGSDTLPLWLTTPTVRRRSGWERAFRQLVRPRPARQRVFAFVERSRRLQRIFKIATAALTLGTVAILLSVLPAGRYLAEWLTCAGDGWP